MPLAGFEPFFEDSGLVVPDDGGPRSQEDGFKLAQEIGLGGLQGSDGGLQLTARVSCHGRLELLLGLGELRIRRVQRLQELGDMAIDGRIERRVDGRIERMRFSRFLRPAGSSTPTAAEDETAGQ